jgi:cytochrome c553
MYKLTITTAMHTRIFAIALVLFSSPILAGDAMAGKEKSQACVACHGEDGNSPNAAYPRLAGQYASYLEHALQAYRSGARQNAIMKGFAEPLSDDDIEDLAAYFASQDGDLRAINPD